MLCFFPELGCTCKPTPGMKHIMAYRLTYIYTYIYDVLTTDMAAKGTFGPEFCCFKTQAELNYKQLVHFLIDTFLIGSQLTEPVSTYARTMLKHASSLYVLFAVTIAPGQCILLLYTAVNKLLFHFDVSCLHRASSTWCSQPLLSMFCGNKKADGSHCCN